MTTTTDSPPSDAEASLPAPEGDSGYWSADQERAYADHRAVSICVLVGADPTRPVAVQYNRGGMSGSLRMPREQARGLGLALLAASEYGVELDGGS